MASIDFTDLKQRALEFGLDDLGIVPATESKTWPIYSDWVDSGQAGEMQWLAKRRDARRHPDSVLPGVKTLLAAALSLARIRKTETRPVPEEKERPHGTVNPYAVCTDYHTLLRRGLRELSQVLAPRFPDAKFRVAVDTAPLLEKEWAARAGLGTIARNSLLLHPRLGTEFFLGFLLTTIPAEAFVNLPAASPHGDPCADCTRCQKACPTGAFNQDRTLNASKCLNYWSIEYRGEEVPREIARFLKKFPFGCDLCRRVCPKNPDIPPRQEVPLDLTPEEFETLFKGTPVERLGYEQFCRNSGGREDP
ncbi:MAG: tRNA epoxyqueuosine(34) reductase QueG [Thermoguttaceae bacterium]|nr:tRNA epoxyqueuosine(34) reductase QueG [Thermoguttaceae bacterium]